MTVYVLQRPKQNHDLSPAKNYGDFRFVWGENFSVYPDNVERRVEEMDEYARKILKDFDAERDYVLLNGDPVGIAIATAILGEDWASITVLKWDRQNNKYYPVTIGL